MLSFPPILPGEPAQLERLIAEYEEQARPLKQGAQAEIIWYDEERKEPTPYAIVYLHGFKGSRGEGAPVHTTIAKRFGCNLYVSRLYGHGLIREQNFDDLTSSALIRSAADACRIGEKLGKKIILMGTSTGGSLALMMAASDSFSSSIAGLILYSPLIHLYGMNTLLLENALVRSILRLYPGKRHQLGGTVAPSSEEDPIWYHSYQLNGALALGQMIQTYMTPSLFGTVQCPAFIGYYYKNRHAHDRMVSTAAIKKMAGQLGTDSSAVALKNFPNAGAHVICSSLLSDAVEEVISSTQQFLIEKMGMNILS
jgi:pimeloyl-ACP methyl ester carboxylesterase